MTELCVRGADGWLEGILEGNNQDNDHVHDVRSGRTRHYEVTRCAQQGVRVVPLQRGIR